LTIFPIIIAPKVVVKRSTLTVTMSAVTERTLVAFILNENIIPNSESIEYSNQYFKN
jgi:hypothetical protein